MNKITIIASVLILTVAQTFAQKEFKLAKSGGKLVINNISNLKVEGYEGREIIFSAAGKKEKTDDPRAAGLSALSNSGFDNTGIGISVIDKENVTIVTPIERNLSLRIKLPHNVALSLKTTGFPQGDSTAITLSNIKSEIDASTQHENILLKDVTGPVSIKTLHGYIEGKLTPSFKGPVSLVSVYGFVDVTIPENAKADLTINTQYETLYAAKDLKLVVDEETSTKNTSNVTTPLTNVNIAEQNAQTIIIDSKTVITGSKGSGTIIASGVPAAATPPSTPVTIAGKPTTQDKKTTSNFSYAYTTNSPLYFNGSRSTTVNGKLNGGGEKIILKSTYGKIYLRK